MRESLGGYVEENDHDREGAYAIRRYVAIPSRVYYGSWLWQIGGCGSIAVEVQPLREAWCGGVGESGDGGVRQKGAAYIIQNTNDNIAQSQESHHVKAAATRSHESSNLTSGALNTTVAILNFNQCSTRRSGLQTASPFMVGDGGTDR